MQWLNAYKDILNLCDKNGKIPGEIPDHYVRFIVANMGMGKTGYNQHGDIRI